MADNNKKRLVRIESPMGDDALLFRSLSGSDELGRLFAYRVGLLSNDHALNFQDLLGQSLTLEMRVADDSLRYFNGVVTELSQEDDSGNYAAYTAVLRPWLWLLTRAADCRIFQNQSIPDIVQKVFEDHGFPDFEVQLTGSFPIWDYCVQYRETDFNFVSRLMEQEGIYYFFRHEKGRHVLVLANSYGNHDALPGYEEIPLRRPDPQVLTHEDCIFGWRPRQMIQPGVYALGDFNFEEPKTPLDARESVSRPHSFAEFEVFDYPGEYDNRDEGNRYALIRLEELQSAHARISAEGNARGIFSGGLFKLTGAARADQAIEYLVISASYQILDGSFESGGAEDGEQFLVQFEVCDSKEPFRPERATPKPSVQGPQTAIVVGPQGEEIWTDEYGRVKVQFHWDRAGKSDEESSGWIRVAQSWAGRNWGSIFLPRVGHEVIVEFLEGDPDWPIITGSVYNGDNAAPYPLPGDKTQSGIKSDTPGGDGANELRFEDGDGSEQIFIHGQKDLEVQIENDALEVIGNDSKLEVKGAYTVTVTKDVTETFQANHVLEVFRDQTVKAMNITIEGTASITLKVGGSSIKIDPSGIAIKGPQVEVNGSALVQVQGGMVKIN